MCKNTDSECRYNRTHTERKQSKISNITFAILPFSDKNDLTIIAILRVFCFLFLFLFVCLVFGFFFLVYFFLINHQIRFKRVHSNTKNTNFRVPQSQVCYLHHRDISRCIHTTHTSAHKRGCPATQQCYFCRENLAYLLGKTLF